MRERHHLPWRSPLPKYFRSWSNVLHIGLAGTEEIYSVVSTFGVDAGIQVTASHNPIDTGTKIVKEGSQPLSDFEFSKIKSMSRKIIFLFRNKLGQ